MSAPLSDRDEAKAEADANAVLEYVTSHPGCSVREARTRTVADSPKRWSAAVGRLGPRLNQTADGPYVRLYAENLVNIEGTPEWCMAYGWAPG
jgi:hypothetical protein